MTEAKDLVRVTTADDGERENAVPAAQQLEEHPAWPMISRLPVVLAARVPLSRFTVRCLLALTSGQTVESAWATTEDVPLMVDDLCVGWSEFEVVDQRMALRLTRIA